MGASHYPPVPYIPQCTTTKRKSQSVPVESSIGGSADSPNGQVQDILLKRPLHLTRTDIG